MSETERPQIWYEPPPLRVDLRIAWWMKLVLFAVATVAAMAWVDQPVAVWAREHPIPDLAYWPGMTPGSATAPGMMSATRPVPGRGDNGRELMFLEQYGQFTCSVVVILAVACLDPKGRRRALAVAMACLATLAVTHLIKDLAGRSRPFVADGSGGWLWRGPFQTSAAWGSFPSAHTTAAFALASSLAWFYPRGRVLFVGLAVITATQRVLHTAHYVSDVTAGMAIGVMTARATLRGKVAGRVMAAMPGGVRGWWMRDV